MLKKTYIVTEFASWMYCEGRGRQLMSSESLIVAQAYALRYADNMWREHYEREGKAPDNVEIRVYEVSINRGERRMSDKDYPFHYTLLEEINRDYIREHERGCDVNECEHARYNELYEY